MQFPNPPLIVALAADLTRNNTHSSTQRAAVAVFYLALGVWAYEEARRGENWFRRALGMAFSVYVLVGLARALHA